MYPFLLALHSLVRWFVLAGLLFSIFRSYKGWLSKSPFTKSDNMLRHITVSIAHIQLLLGLYLYFISPVTGYFLHHFTEAVHQRQIRFFGMEHSTMMLTAIILITAGSSKAARKKTDKEKFRILAIWFSIALFILLSSIPWAFSPLTSRPYFRPF